MYNHFVIQTHFKRGDNMSEKEKPVRVKVRVKDGEKVVITDTTDETTSTHISEEGVGKVTSTSGERTIEKQDDSQKKDRG